MPDPVNYDSIAKDYDRRYRLYDYPGIQQVLRAHVSTSRPWRVLEVGCGTGYWLEILKASGCWVSGLDVSEQMLALAHSRLGEVDLRQGKAESLPWPEATFQRVFMVNALHHFSDPYRSIQEAVRVLQPGGGLVIIGLDPHAEGQRWSLYEYFPETLTQDRKRYPAANQIREWMLAAGLARCKTKQAEHLFSRVGAREALEQGQIDRSFTSQLTSLADDTFNEGRQRLLDDLQAAEAAGRQLELHVDLRLYATEGFKPGDQIPA